MRVLLATYGTRGDVEPMVALAVAIQAAGVEVQVCAPSDRDVIDLHARHGVPLVPFAKAWRAWATEASSAEERVFDVDQYVSAYIDATYETLVQTAMTADIMIASGMLHFVATSAAQVAGIPQRFVAFSPSVLERQPWQAHIVPAIDRHRASIGLLPVADIHEYLFTARPWLAADTILSPNDAAAESMVRSDAWILHDSRPLPDDLSAFLEAGAPPVYLGFGSMRMAAESARIGIEAIRALGHRIVLGRGWAELDAIDQRDDCFAIGEVNHQALFKRVAGTIHHGGAGTTTTSAMAGVPQIIVPQAADQPYWAGQMTRLGIGFAHPAGPPTLSSLSEALRRALMPETAAKAKIVAASMSTNGTTVASARIAHHLINPSGLL